MAARMEGRTARKGLPTAFFCFFLETSLSRTAVTGSHTAPTSPLLSRIASLRASEQCHCAALLHGVHPSFLTQCGAGRCYESTLIFPLAELSRPPR